VKALIKIPTKGLTVDSTYDIISLEETIWVEGFQYPAVRVQTKGGSRLVLIDNVEFVE
jgi:hypothetical protein